MRDCLGNNAADRAAVAGAACAAIPEHICRKITDRDNLVSNVNSRLVAIAIHVSARARNARIEKTARMSGRPKLRAQAALRDSEHVFNSTSCGRFMCLQCGIVASFSTARGVALTVCAGKEFGRQRTIDSSGRPAPTDFLFFVSVFSVVPDSWHTR